MKWHRAMLVSVQSSFSHAIYNVLRSSDPYALRKEVRRHDISFIVHDSQKWSQFMETLCEWPLEHPWSHSFVWPFGLDQGFFSSEKNLSIPGSWCYNFLLNKRFVLNRQWDMNLPLRKTHVLYRRGPYAQLFRWGGLTHQFVSSGVNWLYEVLIVNFLYFSYKFGCFAAIKTLSRALCIWLLL